MEEKEQKAKKPITPNKKKPVAPKAEAKSQKPSEEIHVNVDAIIDENVSLKKDVETLRQRLSIVKHDNEIKDKEIKDLTLELDMLESRIKNYNALPWIKRIFKKIPVTR